AAGERPDMQLEKNRLVPGTPAPLGSFPGVGVIDDFARPRHVLRLKLRGGVRDVQRTVDAELVLRSGIRLGNAHSVPTIRFGLHGVCAVQYQLYAARSRCPQTKRSAVGIKQRSEARRFVHAIPANTLIERGAAFLVAPTSNVVPPGSSAAAAVSSICFQPRYPGQAGSLNVIGSTAALSATYSG